MTFSRYLIPAVVLMSLGGCPSAPSTLATCASLRQRGEADPAKRDGCEPDPLFALTAYRDALAAHNPREAFTWLHPDATEGLDAEGFALLFTRHGDALLAQAEALLTRARASVPDEVARVMTDAGEVIVVKTTQGWRLSAPVGAPP